MESKGPVFFRRRAFPELSGKSVLTKHELSM